MTMTPTPAVSLLIQFEQQYSVNTADITAKIGRLQSVSRSEHMNGMREIQRLLADVSDLLEQMELSVHELPTGSQERTKYDTRVKSYRNDKRQLEIELQRVMERLRSHDDRSDLLSLDESINIDQVNSGVTYKTVNVLARPVNSKH
uniref:V-SNARE domain-containing protein n=1 Tax=Steinernema glaseri TaxID=37863 RepID=A0A1I7YFK3_9BILA